ALVARGAGGLGAALTRRAGSPHAEPQAIEAAATAIAAEAAPDAAPLTLYVNLEPCTHQGRTPPCVDAVLASPVRRVVVAIADPDTRVGGRGIERLPPA